MKYRLKYKQGVNLALQRILYKGGLFDSRLGSSSENCWTVVDGNGDIVGYNFYGFPQSFTIDGRFVSPVKDPDHLIEIEGRPAQSLHDLLRTLAHDTADRALDI